MKIYVSDIGDSSVGIQELTVAELELDQNMVEVLEDNNQMYSFKQEFKRLVEKYCEPETSYDVYSDKDLEEEMMVKYCAADVIATMEMYVNKPEFNLDSFGKVEHPEEEPSYKDIYDSSISRKPVRNKKELKERLKKATESMFDTYGVTKESWNGFHNSKEVKS